MINNILRRPPWRTTALSIAVGLALSACAVGPDFHAPEAPKVADASHPYTPAPLPAMAASAPEPGLRAAALRRRPGHLRHVVGGVPVAGAQRAGAVGAGATAPRWPRRRPTLRQAEENYRADYGSQGVPVGQRPAAGARASATRSPQAAGHPGRRHGQPVHGRRSTCRTRSTSFGGNRRELEGVRAAIDYQRFQVEATWLSLTSSVVATAIQEASLRAQLKATQRRRRRRDEVARA